MSYAYYRFFIGDYSKDTSHLTLLQHGAYRLLIDAYMARGKPLRGDLNAMCRICSALSGEERQAVEFVLTEFFIMDGLFWRNKRCDAELSYQITRSEKARNSANRRGAGRPGSGVSHPEEFKKLVIACGNKCVKCGATDKPLEKDHITPSYQGGIDSIENWQPLCGKCNAAKGAESIDYRPHDYIERLSNDERTLIERQANQNQNHINTKHPRASHDARFDEFWAAYPRKKSKGTALKAWQRLKPDEALTIAINAGLMRAKASEDWKRENGRFIPYPASWLNARGWEDEQGPASTKPKNYVPTW